MLVRYNLVKVNYKLLDYGSVYICYEVFFIDAGTFPGHAGNVHNVLKEIKSSQTHHLCDHCT